MILTQLSVTNFRNLSLDSVAVAPGANLVLGSNGQGKTNLLEAVAVLGNLRSFRQSGPRKLVRIDERDFRLEGCINTEQDRIRLTQIVQTGPPVRRQLLINGAASSLENYLYQFPVFALSARDALLVTGPPDGRRSLIDRLAFFLNQVHLSDLRRYRSCLKQRNAAVMGIVSSAEISLWEERLADAAAKVVISRMRGIKMWRPIFRDLYDALRPSHFPEIDLIYRNDAGIDDIERRKVAHFYRQRYHDNRVRDRQAGFTIDGPHRHDLQLRVGGRTARDVLSAGQVKTVAAALCFSTLALVEERRKESLPILVDDVDAEIDGEVLENLITVLGSRRQMFMSSAHENNLIDVVPEATHYVMIGGSLQSGQRPNEETDE